MLDRTGAIALRRHRLALRRAVLAHDCAQEICNFSVPGAAIARVRALLTPPQWRILRCERMREETDAASSDEAP